jgi:hypothetical protein
MIGFGPVLWSAIAGGAEDWIGTAGWTDAPGEIVGSNFVCADAESLFDLLLTALPSVAAEGSSGPIVLIGAGSTTSDLSWTRSAAGNPPPIKK